MRRLILVRPSVLVPVALLGALSCTDRPSPLAPVPIGGGSPSASVSCTATVASKTITCAPVSSGSAGRQNLVLGGQAVYVTLRSTNVGYIGGVDSIFQGDISVQNLTAQTLGDSDASVTGVRVFFLTGPTNGVTMVGDSVGTFTTTGQHYFVFPDSIGPFGVSPKQTWQWRLHGASTFTFSVLVAAKVEADSGVLRWGPQMTTAVFAGLWAANASAVYGVTEGGSIWRFNGTTWKTMPNGGYVGLEAIWGTDTTNIYAVGGAGQILHYDGRSWAPESTGVTNSLAGVSGTGPNDIYAVGSVVILHFDGASWSPVKIIGATQTFLGVWAASDTAIFAVGDSGQLWKSDGGGAGFQLVGQVLGGVRCFGVWGSSNTNVLASCENGEVLHYNGTAVNTITSDTTTTTSALNAIWGTSASSIYAVGDGPTILQSTDGGVTWSPQSTGFLGNLRSVSGTAANIFAGGEQGTILHSTGTTWSNSLGELTDDFNSVWGTGSTNAYAVGGGGVVAHYNGTAWTNTATLDAGSLNTIWGSGAGDIYTAGLGDGADLKVIVYHSSNGTTWTPDSVLVSAGTGIDNVNAIWGASSSSVYAVGDAGLILHGHAGPANWTVVSPDTGLDLYGVWGTSDNDVWAVGQSGKTLHFNGSTWSQTTQGGGGNLNGVWALDASHVWAVGDGSTILFFNGSVWTAQANPANSDLIAVWGTSASDVYAVGGGVLLHFNGHAWTTQVIGTSSAFASLLGVWGSSSADVFAVGTGIYHGVR